MLPLNVAMTETAVVYPPTAANMRLDGGHPVLELVNTVYGQVGGPMEHDVLAAPEDLVTLARRLGMAGRETPASADALADARTLRGTVDALLRAHLARRPPPEDARAALEQAGRGALGAARLASHGEALRWTWPPDDAHTPVHRLAQAAIELLGEEAELARLHQCDGCRWLFLDHSRGAGRRWCSMADCGTEAKKRRYVQRRRERQQRPG
jgi:predicted RNA-binding Zn ribbon-like protein